MNPFDNVEFSQRKERAESAAYDFFITSGFVTISESKKLYKWYDENWGIRDPLGKSRLKLLQNIPDGDLPALISLEMLRIQPSRLKAELLRRLAPNM
jgi:hypothetical protein